MGPPDGSLRIPNENPASQKLKLLLLVQNAPEPQNLQMSVTQNREGTVGELYLAGEGVCRGFATGGPGFRGLWFICRVMDLGLRV